MFFTYNKGRVNGFCSLNDGYAELNNQCNKMILIKIKLFSQTINTGA